MIYLLDENVVAFPDPHEAEEDGLLAVGGGLTPDWLLTAYANGIFPYGIFPWYGIDGEVPRWFSPQERFVIFPDEIHVSHSMRTFLNARKYHVTINKSFSRVIKGCSEAQGRNKERGAWLDERMIAAYTELHNLGHAYSVEVWEDSDLVGGLYGIIAGRAFCGESMFSLRPNASKVALIFLASRLLSTGKDCLIDCQFETPHLKSMGGRHIPYDDFIRYIHDE